MEFPLTQLEAFHLIALHEGIANASQFKGQSISTLSGHLKDLQGLLNTRLCTRKPFKLTRDGRKLAAGYAAGREKIKATLDAIYRQTRPTLQFAAAEVVTQHYLPGITHELEEIHPNLQCSTESGPEDRLQQMLHDGEVNIAIASEDDRWREYSRARLIELPIVLIAPKSWAAKSAADLWARTEIAEPLFVSTSSDTMGHNFDASLAALRVQWTNRRRVSSALSVTRQVAAGYGFGLTVDVPTLVQHPKVRVLPLENFAPIIISAYWRGTATDVHRSAVQLMRTLAKRLQPAKRKTGQRKR